MSDDWKKEALRPPKPLPPVTIDPAEFLALRLVVGVLIARMAKESEVLQGNPAQAWINDLSAICEEAVLSARIGPEDGRDVEKMRRDILDHVNRIVGTAQFDDDGTKSN